MKLRLGEQSVGLSRVAVCLFVVAVVGCQRGGFGFFPGPDARGGGEVELPEGGGGARDGTPLGRDGGRMDAGIFGVDAALPEGGASRGDAASSESGSGGADAASHEGGAGGADAASHEGGAGGADAASHEGGAGGTDASSNDASLADWVPRSDFRPALVLLSGGTFLMGSPATDTNRYDDEYPVHSVTLGPFYMCETEVTQSQYQALMGTNPSDCRYGCGAEVAVHDISWFDAVEFMNRLSDQEQLPRCYEGTAPTISWPDHHCSGYRLLTEAEWEYAARGGTTTVYSFGDDPAGLDAYAWYDNNAGREAQPVRTKAPNPWGLYDVHGNVWEWVWDWYAADAYTADPVTEPTGPATGRERVYRSGGFGDWARWQRSANRGWYVPSLVYRDNGIRCARTPAR